MISFSFRRWLETTLSSPAKRNDLEVPEPVEDNYVYLQRDPAGQAGGEKDLKSLPNVGTPGNPMGRIDAYIDNMVASWKHFKPTPERVSAGNGGGSPLGDLGAALAGNKVAWFTNYKPGDVSELVIKRIKQRIGSEDPKFARGLTYSHPWAGSKDFAHLAHHILVGPEDKVRKLTKLLQSQQQCIHRGLRVPIPIEREVGLLLGYPPSSVHEYLCGLLGTCSDKERVFNRLELGDSLEDTEKLHSIGSDFLRGLQKPLTVKQIMRGRGAYNGS